MSDESKTNSRLHSLLITHHSSLILQAFTGDELDQVADAAGVAPLVVVPGKHFDQSPSDHLRILRVHD